MNTATLHSAATPTAATQGSNAMQFEASTTINAPIATVFAFYADVAGWPTWDPDLKAASLAGSFTSGAVGQVAPHSGPKSALLFREVVANKRVAMECKLPLGLMLFEYELQAQGGATVATHRTTFSGLLAPLWSRLIGSGMKKTLPAALAGLKRESEAKAA